MYLDNEYVTDSVLYNRVKNHAFLIYYSGADLQSEKLFRSIHFI